MLIDTFQLTSTGSAENLIVARGPTFPQNPDDGELFNLDGILHVYSATAADWVAVGSQFMVPVGAYLDTAALQAMYDIAGGVAAIGVDGKINNAVLPAIAITDTYVVATQSAMLALDAQTGDVAVRTDLSKSFILQGADPTQLAGWVELQAPAAAITSTATVTSWTGVPYDIGGSCFGAPGASAAVTRFIAPRTMTIAASSATTAYCDTPSTGAVTLSIKKNGSQVGTVSFAAGANTGTVSIASPVTLAVGDRLTIVAPATPDATFGDFEISLAATLN